MSGFAESGSPPTVRGERTRPMYTSPGAGPIYIEPWIRRTQRLTTLLSETRDLTSARRFFQKALAAPGHPRPRVVNVDGNPSYPNVIEELKQERVLGRRYRCRIIPYLNNIVGAGSPLD